MKKCYTNCRLIDGKNFYGEAENVIIENGFISTFSDELPPDAEIIDCENKFLSPAWIDVHGHSDLSVFELADGGTRRAGGFGAEIAGNCGLSPFPLTGFNRENLEKVYGEYQTLLEWEDYAQYRSELAERKRGFELYSLCGHNTLHSAVLGYDEKKADFSDINQMCSMLEKTFSDGALGLSLGLLYSPGRFASADELEALFRCCAEHDKMICAHLRSEGDLLIESIREMFELCCKCQVENFHISHLKTAKMRNFYKIDKLFELLDSAEKDYGVDVTFDRYPFTCTMTQLSVAGPEKYLSVPDRIITEKLQESAVREEFLHYLEDLPPEKWEKTMLAKCSIEKFKKFCGMRFCDIAEETGSSAPEIITEILSIDSVGSCGAFESLSGENMQRIICDKRCFCGSDETAAALDGTWHMPRNQFSGYRTIELQMKNGVKLPEIIAKLTWRAAERFKLPCKYELAVGCSDDFTLFCK